MTCTYTSIEQQIINNYKLEVLYGNIWLLEQIETTYFRLKMK